MFSEEDDDALILALEEAEKKAHIQQEFAMPNAFSRIMPLKHKNSTTEAAVWYYPESLSLPRRDYQYNIVKSCLR